VNEPVQTWIPLLLADPSYCLRALVIRDLIGPRADEEEVEELRSLVPEDPLVLGIEALQSDDGAWRDDGLLLPGGPLRATSVALARLGFLGLGPEHTAVRKGVEFLFSVQDEDGSWLLPGAELGRSEAEGYSMVPLQTALPLGGVAACGYAQDERAERAYEWLLSKRLPDGAWPSGIAAGNYGRVAGYRRLPHSRWGCRSNTTGVLRCLSYHPERRSGPAAKRALDLLLGRETREKHTLGFEVARAIGAEPARGFFTYYARFDVALLLDLCWRVGASQDDDRVAAVVRFVVGLQGPYGLWEYAPRPQASRWMTFDLLRSLSRLNADLKGQSDWLGTEPRTPFQAYPGARRRF
jgi:hypothetical protein